MRSICLLGVLLSVLCVMGHAKSIDRLEGRGLTGVESIHPNKLSKRTLSQSNPVSCQDGRLQFDLRDYNKCMTSLLSRHVPCAYFKDIVMFVSTGSGEKGVFETDEPSIVRNILDSRLNDECLVDRPVQLRQNLPPPPPADLDKSIGVVFFHNDSPSKQVITCTNEDDAWAREQFYKRFPKA